MNSTADVATFDHCRHVVQKIIAAEEATCAGGTAFHHGYVEVQIHGPVRLALDVAALHVDGGHRNNPEIDRAAHKFSGQFGVPLRYTR